MSGRMPKAIGAVRGAYTLAEREQREASEKALKTGMPMTEWKATVENAAAHAHFTRLKAAFVAAELDDVLFEGAINRLCSLLAECEELETQRRALMDEQRDLAKQQMSPKEYVDALAALGKLQAGLVNQIDKKRAMILGIEKENCLSVTAKLRAVPKRPSEDDDLLNDPMAALLAAGPPRG